MADDEEAFHFKNLKGDSSSDRKTCACAKEMSSTKQILEPVSSTSRRDSLERRTLTNIPEISARGSPIL